MDQRINLNARLAASLLPSSALLITAVATIRRLGERLLAERDRTSLVRINPDARDEEPPIVPVPLGAVEAIRRIDEARQRADRPTHG